MTTMKYFIIAIAIIAVIAIFLMVFSKNPIFGSSPSEEDHLRFLNSPQYNQEKRIFQNRLPHLYQEMFKRFTWRDYFESLRIGIDRKPDHPLPNVKVDLAEFLAPSEGFKFVWLGHSSLMLNFKGKIILIDPVLAKNASPLSFMIKRFQDAPISLEELPPIDYIIISHDHYDHLDMDLVHYMKNKPTKFITSLGVGSHLNFWGIDKDKISELDWWQSIELDGLQLTATPAQHSSGRSFSKTNQTLWSSWVIKSQQFNLFYSADSGYDTHFQQIGDQYGPFDLAFIENGQYNTKWHEMHLLPEETIKAFQELKAKSMLPIHWGTFNLAWHRWYDPINEISKNSLTNNIELLTPLMGEIVEFGKPRTYQQWWHLQ
jgi:L-ascorbate metabolism protein UlaG (beta-lactamase superfamily)